MGVEITNPINIYKCVRAIYRSLKPSIPAMKPIIMPPVPLASPIRKKNSVPSATFL
jgi:hypothetical protein